MSPAVSLTSLGHELDLSPTSFGTLRPSADVQADTDELRRRLSDDGYLYLPGFFPREEVAAARHEFVRRLQAVGALDPDHPAWDAVSRTGERVADRALARGNIPPRNLIFGPRLLGFYERLLGGEVRHYDHVWTRVIPPGSGTSPHCDLVYMGRGTPNVMTAWIPYGDITLDLGGLMMLEKSHLQAERLRNYLEGDADLYCTNRQRTQRARGHLSNNPVSLRERLGGRWLTAEFGMGDLLTFGMRTVHGSLDNRTRAYRFSSDTRYQLAAEPVDHRWVGPDTEEWAEKNRVGKIC